MRKSVLLTLLFLAACSKGTEDGAATVRAPVEVPATLCNGTAAPADLANLPAPDPDFRAEAREAYLAFAGELDVDAFLRSYPEIARKLREGTRAECLDAVRMCGASHDVRALPLLVRELALSDNEHRTAVGFSIQEIVNAHELERRDPERPEAVHLLPRGEGTVDLRPMCWVLEELLRSGEPNLQGYSASMVGYLGLDALAPLLQALRSSRHPAVRDSVDNALAQLELDR